MKIKEDIVDVRDRIDQLNTVGDITNRLFAIEMEHDMLMAKLETIKKKCPGCGCMVLPDHPCDCDIRTTSGCKCEMCDGTHLLVNNAGQQRFCDYCDCFE